MKFTSLVEVLEQLAATSKRGEKTAIIARHLHTLPKDEIPVNILLLKGRLFPDWDKRKLNVAAKTLIKALVQASGHSLRKVEESWKEKGDLGLVAEEVIGDKKQATLFTQSLTVQEVYDTLVKLSTYTGSRSVSAKIMGVSKLLTSANALEAKYITRFALEVVRIGVGEGVVRDAIVWSEFPNIVLSLRPDEAQEVLRSYAPEETEIVTSFDDILSRGQDTYAKLAAEEKDAREIYNALVKCVQHALDITNEMPKVATLLREQGLAGLSDVSIDVGKPLKVMLAQKVKNIRDGFDRVGSPAALEYKYDGFRMQVHIGESVRLFTRRLEDVTDQFPDVVRAVEKHVNCKDAVLDAEAVGLDPKTRLYQPFQHISQRIRRKYDIDTLALALPVELNVFDVLYHEGATMIDRPFHERRKVIASIIDSEKGVIMPSRIMVTDDEAEANKFYQESLDAGNEGIMFKSMDSPYQPGSRVGSMVKLKPIMDTLDLVVVQGTWGEGKRSKWITSYTVACIDENGELQTVGKVSTGLKELADEGMSFSEMTELLTPLITEESGKDVVVKPEIVIEVAYEEIQQSPTYSSGFALRFPRFVRLRERDPDDASTLDYVQELYEGQ